MHKCTILLTLVALGASLVLASEDLDQQGLSKLPAKPGDYEEFKGVPQKINSLFVNFCKDNREEFYINLKTPPIFNVLFNTLKTFVNNDFDAQKEFVKEAAGAIVSDLSAINAIKSLRFLTISDFISLLARIAEEQDSGMTNGMSNAQSTFQSMAEALFSVVNYAADYNMLTPPQEVVKTIQSVCGSTEGVMEDMRKKFNLHTKQLTESIMRSGEIGVLDNIRYVDVEDVGCLTIKHVFTFNKWCNFVAEMTPVVMRLSEGREE